MASFVLEDSDNLTAILTLNLPKDEYEPKLKKELNNIRKKAQIKGFRQGKVPMSYVKKMYGNSILFDEINKIINTELESFIKDSETSYLGQPLPVEDSFPKLDINSLDDYTFKFELGYAPDVPLQGLDGSMTATSYKIEVDKDDLEKEVHNWKKQFGKRNPADTVSEDDIVTVSVVELVDGEPKEGGLETEVKIAVDMVKDEELKSKLLAAKKGDKMTINIWTIEDRDPSFIKKHILGLEGDVEINDEFDAVVEEILHFEPTVPSKFIFQNSFGAEAYKEYFGEDEPKVENDDEAVEEEPAPPSAEEQEEVMNAVRAKITKEMEASYANSAKGQYYYNIRQAMIEANDFELPLEFLKKWLASQENGKKDMDEKETKDFSENLKWTILESKIAKHYDIKVEYEEIQSNVRQSILGYYGGYAPDEQVDKLTKMIMENQEQVEQRYRQLLAEKLFDRMAEDITPAESSVSRKEFEKLVAESK